MRTVLHLFNFITIAYLASACGKDKAEPVGSVAGEVRILNEFGQPVIDRNGVKISTSTGSTQTNSTGQYELRTSNGTQSITYEKPYLGTYRLTDKTIQGAVTQPLITLGTQPIRGVLSIVIKPGNNAIYVQGLMGDVTPQGLPPRKHRLFLHTAPASPQEYTLTTSGETNVSDDQFFDVITFDQLRAAGLLPGQMIHMRAYSDNTFADTYTDPMTKRKVYPALSKSGSNTVTFTY
ncbi:hypothetical protein [Hymenobacter glacieicola]|uniref:Carboxypeptidase regulatory-like domain-containing protein n=1 Tax=Hymenobacter glacieicola TaxID=1562124 RepID=A0ABQ1X7S3_9BACT|nr:hypothetical protein [Hymenobacter glacieicola]GGG60190.1 hypothetical protein GCM10011378_40200 [Hymenobacter glacieicola]